MRKPEFAYTICIKTTPEPSRFGSTRDIAGMD